MDWYRLLFTVWYYKSYQYKPGPFPAPTNPVTWVSDIIEMKLDLIHGGEGVFSTDWRWQSPVASLKMLPLTLPPSRCLLKPGLSISSKGPYINSLNMIRQMIMTYYGGVGRQYRVVVVGGRLNKYPFLRKSGKGDERRKCQPHHHRHHHQCSVIVTIINHIIIIIIVTNLIISSKNWNTHAFQWYLKKVKETQTQKCILWSLGQTVAL